jgi:ABC-type Fe3+-hydroxamate transport system substrate-binding protein
MAYRKYFRDQLGREIQLDAPPQRIVSVVPSQTELLYDLGLEDHICGLTWFCVNPEGAMKQKTRIGGTKNLKTDKILALKPDLIIANKEENERSQIEALAEKAPVWISDIHHIEDALDMIKGVGEICDREEKAADLNMRIRTGFEQLKAVKPLRTLYLIWKDPYMSIGRDTFIHYTMEKWGLKNVLGDQLRYPEISPEEICALNPELILLSSEPYPFREKHIQELKEILPSAKVALADGEMFSWYGSRLLYVPEYLNTLAGKLGIETL